MAKLELLARIQACLNNDKRPGARKRLLMFKKYVEEESWIKAYYAARDLDLNFYSKYDPPYWHHMYWALSAARYSCK